MRSVLVLCFCLLGRSLGLQKTRIVTTTYGEVEGSLSQRGNYYEFTGVRYALPIKFRAPSQPPSHSEVFKADIRSVACAQPHKRLPFVVPNNHEDCLVINVFTPENFTKTSSLPVMVFIHGGDFKYGSSTPEYYGPKFLVSKDVVMVSFNYRLNAYGFLNLGIKEAPGNAGLKDMRAALRWIQANIAQFGGNPNNVTVFGQGSGGTSAIYLTLSPTTKGLFQRIIVESGTIFTKDSYDPKPLETAESVARALGSKASSPKELLDVFTNTTVEKMMETLKDIPNDVNLFAPSLEAIYEDEEPFLIDTPYNILATGLSHPSLNAVPVMIGQTASEMLSRMTDGNAINERYQSIINGDHSTFIPRSLSVDSENITALISEIKGVYLGNRSDYEGVVSAIYNFENDFAFSGPISLFCDLYSNKTDLPVYSYLFNYVGGRNLGRQMISLNNTAGGTTHYDELFYILELESSPLPIGELDSEVIKAMTTLWTNFARFGNPSPNNASSPWLPHPYKLALSLTPQYVTSSAPERDEYWRSVYFRYGADIRKDTN